MARYRTYKPELFADEKLTECSVDARFLFLGLLPFLDDMGRRQYHPRRIKAEVFPYDVEFTAEVVDALVQELANVGVIELYEIGKQRCLRVPHFLRHQYVRKPTHCYVPPSPREGPNAVRCNCANCKAKAARNGDDDVFPQELPHQYRTSELPVTHKDRTSDALVGEEYTPEVRSKVINQGNVEREKNNTNTSGNSSSSDPPSLTETNAENRRAQSAALDEIVLRMVELLGINPNSQILEVIRGSIRVKSKAKGCTLEAAAQQIGASAAFVSVESPPEDWLEWFADCGYAYVPQGDKRLQDRSANARPVCGGSRCTDGWEQVKVNGTARLRRCETCAQLWRDQGYSSK